MRRILPFFLLFGCLFVIAAFGITAVGRYVKRLPDGFVATVLPPERYAVTLGGVVKGEFYLNDQGKLLCASPAAQKIYMLDAGSGIVEKEIELRKRFKHVKQVAHEGRVYYLFDDTDIYVVDAQYGLLLNIYHDPRKRYYSDFSQVDNRGRLIVVDFGGSSLSTIDLANGVAQANTHVFSLNGVIVSKDVVYYWSRGFNVHALDPDTLELTWKHVDDYTRGHPLVASTDSAVYYNDGSQTKVFDAKTGEPMFEFPSDALQMHITSNRVFSARIAGRGIQCHDLQGNLLWEQGVPTHRLDVVGDYLYAHNNTDKMLAKLAVSDGTPIFNVQWKKGCQVEIVQMEEFDLIQDSTGQVSLVDNATGKELWRSARPPGDMLVPWIVYNNHLIVADGRDKILSYDLTGIYP